MRPWWTLPSTLLTVATLTLLLIGADQPRRAANADDTSAKAETKPNDNADKANTDNDKEEEKEDDKPMSAGTFSGLKLRSIGPALASGRVVDFAVNPERPAEYYVAVASGGVWKTVNAGTTWKPIFDSQKSYSIGCLTLDPRNANVIWAGTGENNSQRSVSFGDGVYRSRDGGKSWKNVGLKESEHIGMIAVHPEDSNTVFVAAQGPLWSAGGDRGLYRTTDGGENWERVLHISDDTGVNEVHIDPEDPDTLYASAWQRRRHVWTQINGGPESGLYKSTDGGENWRKINSGLPKVDLGRIGLDISPVNHNVIYAVVEAADGKGGFYRSTNRGESWHKRGDYTSGSPLYYHEIICDPVLLDRVYALDTFMMVTNDAGKTFKRMPRKNRHVDDHALWIDPDDNTHLLVGCDGGIYETWDHGQNWQFKQNLPITQFYRVSTDNSEPFYNVFGGTQDNNSMGGPSRTTSAAGITSEDWFITVGGDGYETRVDPENPNIIYSLWQYGGLVRYDRATAEQIDIRPREAPGEDPLVWNWDSPLIISPHSNTRLYFAANKLFRSDNRGDSWRAVSDDLTRKIDRDQLEVMGKVWGVDAVAKHRSTSIYGNCVSLSESPLVEGLLYVGTDDGLIHISENGGQNWRTMKAEDLPDVPERTYVSCLTASETDRDTVFVAFDNHKQGDFKPYLLVSRDRGRTWSSIAGDLPERDIVYTVQQDHVKSDLLFTGTEFGLYFSPDFGKRWIRLKGGLPTIAVRDIDVQRRENDLALATFGRGFYLLDDYTPLRQVSDETLEQDAAVFHVKHAWRYIETSRLGGRDGRGSQGASYYTASNPPFGAVLTYYLKEKVRTRKEQRQEAEKKAAKEDKTAPYPTLDALRVEDNERDPLVFFEVKDASGSLIKRVPGKRGKGIHRVAWDLRYPSSEPVRLRAAEQSPWEPNRVGYLALPGRYSATLMKEVDGIVTQLAKPVWFEVRPLGNSTFEPEDRGPVLAFHQKAAKLHRAVRGALEAANDADRKLRLLRKAFFATPDADTTLLSRIDVAGRTLDELLITLRGDRTRSRREFPTGPSVSSRINGIVYSQWFTTSPPTQTQRDSYDHAADEFAKVLDTLRPLIEDEIAAIEKALEQAGAPYTPGRLPVWEKE